MAKVIFLPQPTLEVTLEEGGSLPVGTTYYFTGYYAGHNYLAYSTGLFSAAAEEVSVTTDSTYRSIRIKFKWYDTSTDTWKYTFPPYAGGTAVKWDYSSLKSGGVWKKNNPLEIC